MNYMKRSVEVAVVGGVNNLAVFVDDKFEVFPHRALELRIAQQGGRVICGHDHASVPFNPRPTQLRDTGIGVDKPLESRGSEKYDDGRIDYLYLLEKQRQAGLPLFGQWVAIARRAAFHNICNKSVGLAGEAGNGKDFV